MNDFKISLSGFSVLFKVHRINLLEIEKVFSTSYLGQQVKFESDAPIFKFARTAKEQMTFAVFFLKTSIEL